MVWDARDGVGMFTLPWAGLLTPGCLPKAPSSAQKLSNPAAAGSPLEHLHHDSGHGTWGGFPGQGWARIFRRELPCSHSSAHTHRTRWAPGTKAAALEGQGNRRLPPAPSSSPQPQPQPPSPQIQPPAPARSSPAHMASALSARRPSGASAAAVRPGPALS